ncbi:MAG: hypothetical protein ABSG25_10430 [Bryobacteraceae bacterium]
MPSTGLIGIHGPASSEYSQRRSAEAAAAYNLVRMRNLMAQPA